MIDNVTLKAEQIINIFELWYQIQDCRLNEKIEQ
jgi:hypothetical protein